MALAENGEDMVFSDQFDVGRSTYEILYAPIPKTPIDLEETQLGSLAIIHCDATGVIFRYRMRKTDALSVVPEGGAHLFYTPKDVDLSIKTESGQTA